MSRAKIWRLKSKEERRFKQGHPWVYSNELQESPKGIQAGEAIELHDASGNFLAYGFGNPGSLIAFRALTRDSTKVPETPEQGVSLFTDAIQRAFEMRFRWFTSAMSFRAVFGESDDLPGLVIDRYVGADDANKIVYVVQPHAAGMDKNLEVILQALKNVHDHYSKESPKPTEGWAVLRRDAGSREREGLEKIAPVVVSLGNLQPVDQVASLTPFTFLVSGVNRETIKLSADLIRGQKTGFFFDQLENVRLVSSLVQRKRSIAESKGHARKTFSILDLCSYVGQWSVQLADSVLDQTKPGAVQVSVTAVDASETALEFADQNIRKTFAAELEKKNLTFTRMKADVLDPMPSLGESQFDVVIADPPALIKSRKVIPQGKQAYVQLMTEAVRRTRNGGIIVACSCSQLLSSEDFIEVLAKAAKRGAHGKTVRWLAQGSPSLDHFQRFEFREGHYLKCWIGEVSE